METRKLDEEDLYIRRRTEITGPKTTYHSIILSLLTEPCFRAWTEQLCYILKSPVNDFLLVALRKVQCKSLLGTVGWFFNLQSSIESFEIRMKEISEEDIKQALDRLRTTKKVVLNIHSVDGFQHRNNTMFNTDRVVVRKAKWITIDNLLDMKNCLAITLLEPSFTDVVVNSFIHKWVDGHFPHLEYFCFEIKKEESNEFHTTRVLKGIEYEFEENVIRIYKKGEKGLNLIIGTNKGWHIRSKSGLKASILTLEIEGICTFVLFVWTEESIIVTGENELFE
uniref:FBA_2 domain-containing protein n=2 Tax=Caenorhabditis tropicalis TaxID=1561998 RepID=A0A1I7TMN7_9PELO